MSEESFEIESMDKTQGKVSVAVIGPSGAGKTVGLIKLAMGIRDELYPGQKLADIALFIDTERGSSTKVVGRSLGGEELEKLSLYKFEPPYDVCKLMKLMDYAINKGFKIICIDSYTHFWSGTDGILDRAADLEVQLAGQLKQYGAWSEKEIITKKNILKNLMSSNLVHLLVGMRAKTEYVIEKNARGKNVPRAIGLKEDMQQDVRYEFDVVLNLDKETHGVSILKDRLGYLEIRNTMEDPECPLVVQDGRTLAHLVNEGLTGEEIKERKLKTYRDFILKEKAAKATKVAAIEKSLHSEITSESVAKLTYEQLEKIVAYLKQ